jgi:MOSC domain-containing protein YiiM
MNSPSANLAQIFQINASDGGVPKLPLRSAEVTPLGLTTDRHNDTVHHGGPEKALCLYSLELIRALQKEGHPIFPGSTGENVTLVGLDWTLVVAGLRLRLGWDVEIEVTGFASPCQNIRESFTDHNFNRISWRTNPGWSRAYARILMPGRIVVGDPVSLSS